MKGNGLSRRRARPTVVALFSLFGTWIGFAGCSLMKDRPVQLMSDTAAALRAAKEVSADTLAPDLFRRASDSYFRAQNEYRMKNFSIAESYALRAKRLAEQSEFEAMKQGSSRTSLLPPDEPPPPPTKSTYEPPSGRLYTEIYPGGGAAGSSNPNPNALPTPGVGAAPGGTTGSATGTGGGASNPLGPTAVPGSNFTP